MRISTRACGIETPFTSAAALSSAACTLAAIANKADSRANLENFSMFLSFEMFKWGGSKYNPMRNIACL
jgi:hypothetical protein